MACILFKNHAILYFSVVKTLNSGESLKKTSAEGVISRRMIWMRFC